MSEPHFVFSSMPPRGYCGAPIRARDDSVFIPESGRFCPTRQCGPFFNDFNSLGVPVSHARQSFEKAHLSQEGGECGTNVCSAPDYTYIIPLFRQKCQLTLLAPARDCAEQSIDRLLPLRLPIQVAPAKRLLDPPPAPHMLVVHRVHQRTQENQATPHAAKTSPGSKTRSFMGFSGGERCGDRSRLSSPYIYNVTQFSRKLKLTM